ncbi:MAG: DUF2711 family protein [Bacillota bacterium]
MSKNYFFPSKPNPATDKPIRSFLPSGYTSAAIVLHPFVRMPLDWMPEKSDKPHMVFPTKEDALSLGTPVSWESVRNEAEMNSIKELALGLNMWIGGIQPKYENPAIYKKLKSIIGSSLFPPKEDGLSEMLIDSFIDVIRTNGSKSLHFEKITNGSGSFIIDEISAEDKIFLCSEPITLYDEKEDLMITCYYDEPYSFIISKSSLEELFESKGWEGILCDKKLTHAWFLEEDKLKKFHSTY